MRLTGIWRSAIILTLSVALIVVLFLAGLVGFTLLAYHLNGDENFHAEAINAALVETSDGYTFDAAALLDESGHWAILIGNDGRLRWQYQKPADVPETYTLSDVASFTRWFLEDYPVRTRIRDDGLLVIGAPKYSLQRYMMEIATNSIVPALLWFSGLFLLMLVGVLAISTLLLRRWFRRDQQQVDAARADWINGISHDIRTPLSLVMGKAASLEENATLPTEARQQASIIRRQSLTIRDLVGDLNLTMRLDTAMQPLRREWVQPSALLRQVTADFLNSGMAEGYPVDIDLPQQPLPPLYADAFLLRRALNNLLGNAVRHNPPGCPIRIGGQVEGNALLLYVESDAPAQTRPAAGEALAQDGNAAHGTGLKLVKQIAAAHDGTALFYQGPCFRCTLRLPLS